MVTKTARLSVREGIILPVGVVFDIAKLERDSHEPDFSEEDD